MAFNGLLLEYALDCISKSIAWKDMIEALLEDNVLKEFINNDVPKPARTNVANLDGQQKKMAKVKRILLEGV